MIYKPRKLQYISAFKFTKYDENNYMLDLLGIEKPPKIFGVCQCGKPVSSHGFYKNQLLCPNVYIMYEGNVITSVMSIENFESIYEPLYNEEDVAGEADA